MSGEPIRESVFYGLIEAFVLGAVLITALMVWNTLVWEQVCEESMGGVWIEGECLDVERVEP